MKSTTTLIEGFKFKIEDGRGHELIIDLPEAKGGTNAGPTALELAGMSLSGCIGTIFALVAKNSKLSYSGLRVVVEAEKGSDAKTINSARAKIYVKTKAAKEKVTGILEKTFSHCPVGVLFEQAGVKIESELIIEA